MKSKIMAMAGCVVGVVLAVPLLAFAWGGAGTSNFTDHEKAAPTSQVAMVQRQENPQSAAGYDQVESAASAAQAPRIASAPVCPGLGFIDQNGDGICDHCGIRDGCSLGCIDQDGDGFCDNHGHQNGHGRGHGAGWGHHGCGRGRC